MKHLFTLLLIAGLGSILAQPKNHYVIFPGCDTAKDIANCFMDNIDKVIEEEFKLPEGLEYDNDLVLKIKFTVNTEGDIEDVEVLGTENEELIKEAMRIVSILPKLEPARRGGEAVSQNITLPVFSSRDDDGTPLQFAVVEKRPVFPGCEDFESEDERNLCFQQKMGQHIGANFRFPETARKEGAGGVIIVNFIIEKDGSISEARILRSVHPDLDEEALRVILLLPNFYPAMQRGKPVRMSFNMPINAKSNTTPARNGSGKKFQKK